MNRDEPDAVSTAFEELVRANELGDQMPTDIIHKTLGEMSFAEREVAIQELSNKLRQFLISKNEQIPAADLLASAPAVIGATSDDVARVLSRLLSSGDVLLTPRAEVMIAKPKN